MGIKGFLGFGQRREIGPVQNPAETISGNEVASEQKGGSYMERVERVPSADAALKISTYYRGVELRARTMSQLVWQYQRKDRAGGNYITDCYGQNGRLNYLLQVRPNALMTAAEMAKQMEICTVQHGNGVIWIERNETGEIVALWLAREASYNLYDNTYTLTVAMPGGLRMLPEVPASDVIHRRNTYTTHDGLVGVGTLQYMRSTLELDATNIRLQTEMAAKGGRVKLVVQEKESRSQGVKSRYDQKQIEKVARKLNDDIYDNDVSMLSNAAGFQNISMTLADMQVLESRKLSAEDVARYLGVPGYLLGLRDSAGYKGPEEAMQGFLQFTIAPNINELEQEADSKILGVRDFGARRIHICDMQLRRLDPTGQAKLNRSLLEIGVKTINDLRKEYDMPSIKKGDTPYVFSGMAEVGSDKLRATQATNVKASPPDPLSEGRGGEKNDSVNDGQEGEKGGEG